MSETGDQIEKANEFLARAEKTVTNQKNIDTLIARAQVHATLAVAEALRNLGWGVRP